jgi:hypothetical protein
MKKYRITKYNPKNRNEEGHYLYDHWTDISDVGKTLEGELVTQKEYFKIEQDYINAIIEILTESKQKYLRLVSYDNDRYIDSIKDNVNEWFHNSDFENLNIYEDKKILLSEIPTIIKLNLRGYIDTSLEIKDQFYIQFGYDFYMYSGTPNLSQETVERINSTSVFIEEFWSPYYSPDLEYVVESNKKDSMYVEGQQTLESMSIDKMKNIFQLSDEHPGKIYSKLNSEIVNKLEIKADFDKNEYYLTTELKFE